MIVAQMSEVPEWQACVLAGGLGGGEGRLSVHYPYLRTKRDVRRRRMNKAGEERIPACEAFAHVQEVERDALRCTFRDVISPAALFT